MGMPTDPKKLLVRDRLVTVLENIVGGSVYFYTPASVGKRAQHWKEVTEGPDYSVHFDSEGQITVGLNGWRTEEFHMNIKGVVVSEEDPGAAIVRCLRDVRYAIDQDMNSTVSGSLGSLCDGLYFDEGAETDNGYLSLEGKGQFEQRIRFVVSGTIDTL